MRGYNYPNTSAFSHPDFYTLEGVSVPSIHGVAAMSQAAGSFTAAGVEIFVAGATMTQARGAIAGTGVLRFVAGATMTQAAAAVAAVGHITFVAGATMTQARGTITASGEVNDPPLLIGGVGGSSLQQIVFTFANPVRGRARVTQQRGAIAARGTVQQLVTGAARSEQLEGSLAVAGRVKQKVRGRGVTGCARGDMAGVGRVRGRIRGAASVTQPAPALTIRASASWYEDDEERLLLGVGDS